MVAGEFFFCFFFFGLNDNWNGVVAMRSEEYHQAETLQLFPLCDCLLLVATSVLN